MKEIWCSYNTLSDAITELAIPSEKHSQWAEAIRMNKSGVLSSEEIEVFARLLPCWHREFLLHKNYPTYAIKTSLARLVSKEEGAKDLWNDAALFCLRNTPTALSIIHLSMLVYPLIDLAVFRRQLCQEIITEIKKGNLKPYFYPESLEGNNLSDREKLQAFIRLPLTEQVRAKVEINELGRALTTTESFQRQAYTLWKRYHDRARGIEEIEEPTTVSTPLSNAKIYRLSESTLAGSGATQRLFIELFRLYGKEVYDWREIWAFAISACEQSKLVIGKVSIGGGAKSGASVHTVFYDKERNREWKEGKFRKAFDKLTDKVTL